MTRLEDLLRELGKVAPLAGEPRPSIEPEALAELHAEVSAGGALSAPSDPLAAADLGGGVWRSLFSAEAGPGEADWAPSEAALARVAAALDPSALSRGLSLVVRLAGEAIEILRHTGELLAPQPLALRSAAAEAAIPSHTFRHRMADYEAAVGLEAEGDGRFGVTLTLEGAEVEPAVRVTLWEGERRRAVQTGDGAVHIGGLKRGHYRLEVRADGAEVGAIDLEVQDGEPGD